MRSRIAVASALALAAAAPAVASFHLMRIMEVFPGTVSAPNAQYVMIRSYAAGQKFLGSHKIHVYGANGSEVSGSPFTFPGSVANGPDQMEVWIATGEAASLFNLTADLSMTPVLPLAGGMVCYDAIDCVSWGSYHGSATLPSPTGTPFNAPVGLVQGQTMQRRLDICMGATTLEACDDTNDSANDFKFATPAPKNDAGTLGTIPPATCGNSILEGLESCDDGNTNGGDGCSAVCQFEPAASAAAALVLDDSSSSPPGNNGVLEPGEAATLAPAWTNNGTSALALTGTAANFTGPLPATYAISTATADYGTIAPSDTASCSTGGGCYSITASTLGSRPAQHWDATLTEVLSNTAFKLWTVHIGASFTDVPTSFLFYPFIENLFHHGVTGGCASGNYCPGDPVTRSQMAVFLLKGEHGGTYTPPVCSATDFTDVPCPDGANVNWINQLHAESITGGCGGGNYCPSDPVTRSQMAVFLLKAEHGGAYLPPTCATTVFTDVPCPDGANVNWINQLNAEGITGGCTLTTYCPLDSVTRGQMAVFLVKTFALLLYGP
jgi:cysteine-rich repeat protein